MSPIFKCNHKVKYSTKDLKGGYTDNDFSLIDVYLNEKGPFAKLQLLNNFEDHHTVIKISVTVVGYDECKLSNALWMKFYKSYSK